MAKLQSVNSVVGKETIYVDVDDEITAIIDKVGSAKGKVVALVLPKRCPVLQSVVNMKLLKRTADKVGKNLVLVTSEPSLMPLAGATGLYVASSPSSKPVVPELPSEADDGPEEMEEPLSIVDGNAPEDDFDAKSSAGKSVGDLAAAGAAAEVADDEADIDDTIDMNDPNPEPADEAADAADEGKGKKAKKEKKPKKDKKLHVPNFDSFKKRLMLGALVIVLLIAAWYVAFNVLPKATVTIGTDSSTIPTNLTLTLDTSANSLDTTNDVVPAVAQTSSKTNTGTAQASGQQNNGQKATGSVAVTNCTSDNSEVSMPAGSTITSGGNTYVLDGTVDIMFSGVHGNKPCQTSGADSATVNITALSAGSNSNTSGNASFSSSQGSSVQISGSATGGTDNITTVVQQSDITNATNKAQSSDSSSIKQELEQGLEAKGLQPVPATFLAGTPSVSANQQAGAAASSVTVTTTTSYSMLGVNKSDLQTLVDSNVNGQLDKGKQVILSDGVANAQFAEANPGTATNATVAMTAYSQAGPQINKNNLKGQLSGMHDADVQSYVKQTPGVTNVNVKYSPFWVDTIPKNAKKVTINIVKGGS